jgi:hypothetical protein
MNFDLCRKTAATVIYKVIGFTEIVAGPANDLKLLI